MQLAGVFFFFGLAVDGDAFDLTSQEARKTEAGVFIGARSLNTLEGTDERCDAMTRKAGRG